MGEGAGEGGIMIDPEIWEIEQAWGDVDGEKE